MKFKHALKSTTKSTIVENDTKDAFVYDLKVKNYNDLIYRRLENEKIGKGNIPLVLILIILPNEKENWMKLNELEEFIRLGGTAYWYYPFNENDYSENEYSKRIKIIRENKINLDFFENIFKLLTR